MARCRGHGPAVLVRPEYPDAARDKDLEGVVELVALVDTTGSVTEVHIVGGTGNADFEQSATNAVLLSSPRRSQRSGERQPQS